MNQSQYEFPLLGVEQSCHGHLYRWIYTEEGWSNFNRGRDDGPFDADGQKWIDIGCPIGGSNSSATVIQQLHSLEEVKEFLLNSWETDLEDPMLVDIAEGIFTIETDDSYYQSITSEFVKHFNIPEEELTKDNSLYQPALEMIEEIKAFDTERNSELDYENPFYGESEKMRYSELQALLDSYKATINGFYIEISHDSQRRSILQVLEDIGYHWNSGALPVEYGMSLENADFIHVTPLSEKILYYDSKKLLKSYSNLERPVDAPVISGYDFLREPELYFSKMEQPTNTRCF